MNKRNERKQKCKERNEKEICFFESKSIDEYHICIEMFSCD